MVVNSAFVEIETRVSEILYYVWDPIGINGIPACRDEYEDYVPIVSAYLSHNAPDVRVEAQLKFIMEESIGLRTTKRPRRTAKHKETIRLLVEIKNDFFSKNPVSKISVRDLPAKACFSDQLQWSREKSLAKK